MDRTTTHIRVASAADEVYGLAADVTLWTATFEPTVHVPHLPRTERDERFQMCALVAGGVKTWVSRRHLDPVTRRIPGRVGPSGSVVRV